MLRSTIIVIVFLLLPKTPFAQFSSSNDQSNQVIRNYHTLSYLNYMYGQNPNYASGIDGGINELNNQGVTSNLQPKKIAIVFHVLYKGLHEKVDKSRLREQIDALNRDFNAVNINSQNWAERSSSIQVSPVNCEIEFCKPLRQPNNQRFRSHTYKETSVDQFIGYNSPKSTGTGGVSAWDATKYLNVWVCDLPNNISGYAQLPGGPSNYDGIVIDHNYIIGGSQVNYNEGKTLTHLVGNYLGLFPLWGPNKCEDDFVSDTPIHNDPNIGCPDVVNHVTACSGYVPEMTMNFMDNTDDVCLYMFTQGQKERMHHSLSSSGLRQGLILTPLGCTEDIAIGRSQEETEIVNRDFALIPNITNSEFRLSLEGFESSELVHVFIYSINGQLVLTDSFYAHNKIKNYAGDNWSPGIYTVQLQSKQYHEVKRLIIQK